MTEIDITKREIYHNIDQHGRTGKFLRQEEREKQDKYSVCLLYTAPEYSTAGNIVKESSLSVISGRRRLLTDSGAFYFTTGCVKPAYCVQKFIESRFKKKIVYGEFSSGNGATLESVLPFCRKAYATEFRLKADITRLRLLHNPKSKILDLYILKDRSSLQDYLESLLKDGIYLDLVFYDADHWSRYPDVFRLLRKLAGVLIVHDTDWQAVAEDCEDILSDIPYEQIEKNARAYIIDRSVIEGDVNG